MSTEISIIVPFYNAMTYFNRLCVSLRDYANDQRIEILIVNDASHIEEKEALIEAVSGLKWSNIRVIHAHENGGAAKARKIGIEHAVGEYIAFLDSDDGWVKNKLFAQKRLMEERGVAISGNPCKQIDEAQFVEVRQAMPTYTARPYSRLHALFSNRFSTPSVMVKRTVALKYPFDERLRYSEDADCWRRILLNHRGVILSEDNAFMFKHAYASGAGSLSANTTKMSLSQFMSLYRLAVSDHVTMGYRLLLPIAMVWSGVKALRREWIRKTT
ncbi:glycosyltransferase family 2 protein [Aestuariibacter sp. AA17]|uniref:Glycosyltransferase family 2 protein n=1 Tax=Fluctibacter corallii TaxID=2984329 RepID=A0ABT3AEF6_9ALTE|nr:glycosyltransferase family 2 protein [Aestuariibacter sp. AA17]MCV2886687.1 glycosyltransferase family 2 protein [Aestuariibacter sp. AA17]